MLWSSSSIKILINFVNWRKSSLQNPYPQILLLKLWSNCKSQTCLFSFMDSLSWWSFGNKGCLLGKPKPQRNPLPSMLERPLTGIPSIIGSKLEGLVSLVFLYIPFLCENFLVYIMLLFPLAQSRPLVGKVSNDLSWKYPCFMKNFSLFFPPRTSIIMNLASCQEKC